MAKSSKRTKIPARSGGKIRRFVETCGKHPFATGLFALLGIFGLIFSFITFGIDQHQTAQDQVQADQVQSSLGKVQKTVSRISASMTDDPIVDPLISRSPPLLNALDNIAFSGTPGEPTYPWVFTHMKNSFANILTLQWSIKSNANQEFVQIAPYLVIDVIEVTPVPQHLSAIYAGERGGASELRSFDAALLPKKGMQFAALVDDDNDRIRKDVDYFTLSPKEPEEFFLSISYVPGFIYTYRVGAHYRFKGVDTIHWLTGPIRAGIPDYPLPVAEFETGEFVVRDHPDFNAAAKDSVPARSAALLRAVEAGKVFRPTQLH